MKKIKASIKPLTRRCNGRSIEAIANLLRPKLQGFFGYFKHASEGTLGSLDGWIRGRLRSILRKRAGLRGRARGRDHQRWPNHYFAKLGLFDLEEARRLEIISLSKSANC